MNSLSISPYTPKMKRVRWAPEYLIPPAAPTKKEKEVSHGDPPSPPRRTPYDPVEPPISAPPLDSTAPSPVSTEASIKKKRKKRARPSGPLRRSARIAAKNARNQPLRRSLRLAIKNGETDLIFIPISLPDSRRSKRKVDRTSEATNDIEEMEWENTYDGVEDMDWEYTYDGVEDMDWEYTYDGAEEMELESTP